MTSIPVRVRIKAIPQQTEIDGVRLDDLAPGDLRTVSAIVGAWLIAEGYAEPEMRRERSDDEGKPAPPHPGDRRDPRQQNQGTSRDRKASATRR
jgi:hypothetical protein